jgi:hypothetical protein
MEMRRQVLQGRRTALGERHPETLNAANNLADTLKMRGGEGDYAEAEVGLHHTLLSHTHNSHKQTRTCTHAPAITHVCT